jgi:hypothetical protein
MSPAERLRREAHRLHRREPGALEALLELAEEIEARPAPCADCDATAGLHRLGCPVETPGTVPAPQSELDACKIFQCEEPALGEGNPFCQRHRRYLSEEPGRSFVAALAARESAPPRPCLDPDKMHGAADGFGGSDY